ncbi:MAG: LysM peptidoglycan-binding domain-containing protein [Candidatus Nitrospinota bacterium M3_3B_026]
MRLASRTFLLPFFIILAFFAASGAQGSEVARDPEFRKLLASLGPDSPYNGGVKADVIYHGETDFPVPSGLRERVDFWKDIYSRHTTRHVVIHDKKHPGVIYEVIDLDKVFKGRKMSRRAKRRYVRQRKQHYTRILQRLYKNKGRARSEEQRAVAAKFDAIPGYKKFRYASWRVRAQLGQADRFRRGLERSGRYIGKMREIFRSHSLPDELTVLPHVESSFNYDAYSSAGAAGIWQFTRGTGRLFMKIGYTIDERRDPIVSTHAAARLLRKNYEELGSWPLAITAYNHGLNGMRRAKRKFGDDIVKIIDHYKSRRFGFASRNFYAEFLAALDVVRDYRDHFGPIDFERRFRYDEVAMTHYVAARTLAGAAGIPIEVLKDYNPALRKSVWRGHRHIPRGFRLRVPEGMGSSASSALASLAPGQKYAEQKHNGFHIVRRGDTLGALARRYGATVSSMKSVNGLRSDLIRVGQRLRVPGSYSGGGQSGGDHHYVRPGDNLYLIARRYGATVSELARINGISRRDTIYPGQKILLRREKSPVMTASISPAVATADDGESIPSAQPAVFTPPEDDGGQQPKVNIEGESVTVNGRTLRVRASDFAVGLIDSGVGVVIVKAEESLGLYADWLRVSQRSIRGMNRGLSNRSMKIGREVRIPLTRVNRESFERKRIEYHMGLMEDFFDAYRIDGENNVAIRRGQSLWDLCVNENDAPIWLVRLYNPSLAIDSLTPGDTIIIPRVVKK